MSSDTAATSTPSGPGGGRRRVPILEGVLPLDRRRVPWLADLTPEVRAELDRYGVLTQLGTDAVFASVGDAVDAFDALPAGGRSPGSGDDAV